MSETHFMAKTPQLHPKEGIPVSYPNSPLSSYSGDLVLQFAPCPFYTFVALSPIVLYQLESLNLDDYNLTYSQNKNRGFNIFLIAFPFYKHSSKPIQTNPNQYQSTIHFKTQPNTAPILIYNKSKLPLYKVKVFPQIQTQEKEVRV